MSRAHFAAVRFAGLVAAVVALLALDAAWSMAVEAAGEPERPVAVAQAQPAAPAREGHPHDMLAPAVQSGAPESGRPRLPTLPGQDAFGAVQEIVALLEADPATDWARVDLEALRQHLIDMSRVTLDAGAVARPIDGGVQVDVTGSGRTLAAIRRMLSEHAHELARMPGWAARTEPLVDGVRLTVTSADRNEVARIRGLGFIGLMASGTHHQAHHLAMAKGEPIH